MTPRQLRQHLRTILSNVLDMDIDLIVQEYTPHNPPKAPWEEAYERCFNPSVLPHAMNLDLEFPREFSGDYGRDVLTLYMAAAAAEYLDPHRLPEGVVCPKKTGWYHACVYASSHRNRAVWQYVLFVGIDAQAFGEEVSPPYVMVVGTERRITLDMVASWGEPLPTPGDVGQVKKVLARVAEIPVVPTETEDEKVVDDLVRLHHGSVSPQTVVDAEAIHYLADHMREQSTKHADAGEATKAGAWLRCAALVRGLLDPKKDEG